MRIFSLFVLVSVGSLSFGSDSKKDSTPKENQSINNLPPSYDSLTFKDPNTVYCNGEFVNVEELLNDAMRTKEVTEFGSYLHWTQSSGLDPTNLKLIAHFIDPAKYKIAENQFLQFIKYGQAVAGVDTRLEPFISKPKLKTQLEEAQNDLYEKLHSLYIADDGVIGRMKKNDRKTIEDLILQLEEKGFKLRSNSLKTILSNYKPPKNPINRARQFTPKHLICLKHYIFNGMYFQDKDHFQSIRNYLMENFKVFSNDIKLRDYSDIMAKNPKSLSDVDLYVLMPAIEVLTALKETYQLANEGKISNHVDNDRTALKDLTDILSEEHCQSLYDFYNKVLNFPYQAYRTYRNR